MVGVTIGFYARTLSLVNTALKVNTHSAVAEFEGVEGSLDGGVKAFGVWVHRW
jgi:hypothetical protein